jgi:hypothetical protein
MTPPPNATTLDATTQDAMSLRELQHLFWRAVRFDPAPEAVDRAFLSRGPLSARERMAIYRDMYWFRQVDALFAEFPRLANALGAERFTRLVSGYIAAHPSEHPCLEALGRKLDAFLRDHEDESLRPLADLAALEWARTRAFLVPDPPRIARLAEVDPAAFATCVLRFVPSVDVVTIDRAALDAWEAGSAPPALSTAAHTDVLVFRKGFFVYHVALDADEAEALRRARAGEPLAVVCDAFAAHDDPVPRAFAVFGSWFARELVASIEAAGA